jgi:hypothetical protein
VTPVVPAADLHLVPPPDGGVYRLARGPDPFVWYPAKTLAETEDGSLVLLSGNRFDAPDGEFRSLYAATAPYGCALEKLAAFRDSQSDYEQKIIDATSGGDPDAQNIEDATGPDPDQEFDRPLLRGIVPRDYFDSREGAPDTRIVLGHARLNHDALFVDVEHEQTIAALDRLVDRKLLASFGVDRVDRGLVHNRNRRITRPLAREIHRIATSRTDAGLPGLNAVGIRFTSAHSENVECWAIWEPAIHYMRDHAVYAVDFTSDAIQAAARTMDLELPASTDPSPMPPGMPSSW